jgi:hypothetical protein
MIEILRDSVWQFIGTVIAIIALAASYVYYKKQQNRKSLSYEIIARTSVLSVSEEVQGKIQILFQDAPVKDVYLLVVRLSNTGNVPIASSDWESNINIDLGESTKILSAEVSEASPSDLPVQISTAESSIELKPLLLNSSDAITIKALVSNYQKKLSIGGRISGVKKIEQKIREKNPVSLLIVLWVLSTLIFLVSYASLRDVLPLSMDWLSHAILPVSIFLGGCAAIYLWTASLTK